MMVHRWSDGILRYKVFCGTCGKKSFTSNKKTAKDNNWKCKTHRSLNKKIDELIVKNKKIKSISLMTKGEFLEVEINDELRKDIELKFKSPVDVSDSIVQTSSFERHDLDWWYNVKLLSFLLGLVTFLFVAYSMGWFR